MPGEYPDLSAMYGAGSPAMLPQVLDQYQQAQQAGQINNIKSLQDIMLADQTNPLKVQQQGLANQTTEAQLPGVQAQSNLLKDKADVSRSTIIGQMDEAQRKHVLSAKEDDIKMMGLAAQQMMYSPDPKVREQGKALYMMKGEIVEEQAKQIAMLDRQAALEKMKQEGLDRRALLAAQAKASAQKKVSSLKLSFEQAYNYYTDLASKAKSAEEAQAYNELAENARQNWIYAKQNKPVDPNAVNVPGLANVPAAQPAAPPPARTDRPTSPKVDDPFSGFTITPKK